MSDTPLFQNSDEQEQTYAPHQLPEGSAGERAAAAEGDTGAATGTADAAFLPAAFAAGSNTGGMGPAVGTAGTASGVAPAAGLAGLAGALDDDDPPSGDNKSGA
jgi:hypothetical protein